MVRAKIRINSINSVKDFVEKAQKAPFEIDVTHERYTVDAKSIMGLFSIDCSKPLNIIIYSDDSAAIDKFFKSIKNYIVVTD